MLAIGDFSENLSILNPPTLILCHKDTPTKLHAYAILLHMRGWNGRDTEWLLIVNFKIVRIPPIAFYRQIHQILLSPINTLVQ